MPFFPINTPTFYSAMMKSMKDEWDDLFILRLQELSHVGGEEVVVTTTMEIYVGSVKVVSGTIIVIDDILLWCSNVLLIRIYLECICKMFRKYRVSFCLDKCDFFKPRIEYVGHDVTNDGNCTASSKFNMINDWVIPEPVESLFSFIGLINFYHRYAPYMEIRLKPLRKLLKTYY